MSSVRGVEPGMAAGTATGKDDRYERAIRLAKRLKQMLESQKKVVSNYKARMQRLLGSVRTQLEARRPIEGSGSDGGLLDIDGGQSLNKAAFDAMLPADGTISSDSAAQGAQLAQSLLSDVVSRAAAGTGAEALQPLCVLHSEENNAASVSQSGQPPSMQAWVLVEMTPSAPDGAKGAGAAGISAAERTQVWVRGSALQLVGEEDDEPDGETDEDAVAAAAAASTRQQLLQADWAAVPVLSLQSQIEGGKARAAEHRASGTSTGERHGGGNASGSALALAQAREELEELRHALAESRAAEGRARVQAEVGARRAAAELAEAKRALAAAEDESASLRDSAGEAAAAARAAEAGRVQAQEAASAALRGALAGDLGGSPLTQTEAGDRQGRESGSRAGLRYDVPGEAGGSGDGSVSAGAGGRDVEMEKLRRDFAAYRRRAMELLKQKERISDEAEEAAADMRRQLRAARDRLEEAEQEASRLRRMQGAASAVPVQRIPLSLPAPASSRDGGGTGAGTGAGLGAGGGASGAARAMLAASEAAARGAAGRGARAGDSVAVASNGGVSGQGSANESGADAQEGANEARMAYLRNLVLRYMLQRRRAMREQTELGAGMGAALGGSSGPLDASGLGGSSGLLAQMEAAIADILGFGDGERRALEGREDRVGVGGSPVRASRGVVQGLRGAVRPSPGGAFASSTGGGRPLGLLAKRDMELRARAAGEGTGAGTGGLVGDDAGGLLGGLWSAIVGPQEQHERPSAVVGRASGTPGAAGTTRQASVLDSAPG